MSAPEPKLLDRVRAAVRLRHYSPRTAEAYVFLVRRLYSSTEWAPLARATTADANSNASIAGIRQNRYAADGPIEGSVVGFARLATANHARLKSFGVGAALQPTASGRRRRGALFWTAVGAGAGIASGFIMNATKPACDEPDNMCSVNVVVLGGTGALMGFFVGLGR